MNYTITTNLDCSAYNFLVEQASTTKKTKKSIIEEALKIYQKQELKKQIEKGLEERYKEQKTLNAEYSETQFKSLNF
ncbi:MAG: hypothetical protein LBD88_02200 [Candidatus Peribacteria bacterium]|jgi:hypothetical protein|nr:hypothetical protein [Candidatus Peribacteria bacterium]